MDIDRMKQVAKEYWKFVEDVDMWCYKMARAVQYDYVENVQLHEDMFSFSAVWYGPYQATDTKNFSFSYDKLLLEPEAVADVFKQDQQKADEELKKLAQEEERLRKLSQLEKLKKELGVL